MLKTSDTFDTRLVSITLHPAGRAGSPAPRLSLGSARGSAGKEVVQVAGSNPESRPAWAAKIGGTQVAGVNPGQHLRRADAQEPRRLADR